MFAYVALAPVSFTFLSVHVVWAYMGQKNEGFCFKNVFGQISGQTFILKMWGSSEQMI